MLSLVFIFSCLLLLQACDEPGRIRASASKLVGVYETTLDHGSERLELRADGTYIQEISTTTKKLEHSGQWHIENRFLSGSDVVLSDAAISDDERLPIQLGEMNLNVHERSGKLALARNEVAEWYYERIP